MAASQISHTLTLMHSKSYSHTHTCSVLHSHTLMYTLTPHTHALTHSLHTHAHSLTHTHTLSLTHILSLTHTYSLSHTHTLSHTHILSLTHTDLSCPSTAKSSHMALLRLEGASSKAESSSVAGVLVSGSLHLCTGSPPLLQNHFWHSLRCKALL